MYTISPSSSCSPDRRSHSDLSDLLLEVQLPKCWQHAIVIFSGHRSRLAMIPVTAWPQHQIYADAKTAPTSTMELEWLLFCTQDIVRLAEALMLSQELLAQPLCS